MHRDGSSFMWHQLCQRCKYTTLVDSQKHTIKSCSLGQNHMWAQWVCSRVENSFTYKSNQQPFFIISRDLQAFPLSVPVLQVTNGLWCIKWWNCKSVSVTWWHLWSTWLGLRGTCCVFQHASHIVPTWDWEAHAVCFSMHPTLLQIGTEKHMLCVSACVPHCSNLGQRGMCYVLHHVSHVAPTWDWEAHAMSCVSACIPHCSNLGLRGRHVLCASSRVPCCSNLGLRGTCYVMCFSMHPTLLQLGTERHTLFQHASHMLQHGTQRHMLSFSMHHTLFQPETERHALCVSAHPPHCSNLGLRGTHCVSACIPHCSSLEPRATCYVFQSASHIAPTWDREARAMCFSMCPTLFQLGTERYMLCVSACIPYCSELGLRGTCYVFQCATHIAPTWDWEARAMYFCMCPTLFQLGTERHVLCVSAHVPHCSDSQSPKHSCDQDKGKCAICIINYIHACHPTSAILFCGVCAGTGLSHVLVFIYQTSKVRNH